MPYFGSSIESAANTAWQADNSIRDRLNANAWRMYNAAAQNRNMLTQDDMAALEAMRMGRADAAQNYFRLADREMRERELAEGRRLQEDERRRLAEQQALENMLKIEQLETLKKAQEAEQAELNRQQAEIEMARKRMPEIMAKDYYNTKTTLEALQRDIEKKSDELSGYISGVRRHGGYFDSSKRKVVTTSPPTDETSKKYLPLYESKIESTLSEIEAISRKINEAKQRLSEINSEAMKMGFVYGEPTYGAVPVSSIYSGQNNFIPVASKSGYGGAYGARPEPRFRFNPDTGRIEPKQ